jgi:hypothetical protein
VAGIEHIRNPLKGVATGRSPTISEYASREHDRIRSSSLNERSRRTDPQSPIVPGADTVEFVKGQGFHPHAVSCVAGEQTLGSVHQALEGTFVPADRKVSRRSRGTDRGTPPGLLNTLGPTTTHGLDKSIFSEASVIWSVAL